MLSSSYLVENNALTLQLGSVILRGGLPIIQHTYPLTALGLQGPLYIFDWTASQPWPEPVTEISLTLQRHEGRLLFVSREPINEAPATLP